MTLMKRIAKAGMAVGILFGSAFVAYAITSLLFTQSQTSSFQKKTIFRFNLSTGLTSGEIGPGDLFSTKRIQLAPFVLVDVADCCSCGEIG